MKSNQLQKIMNIVRATGENAFIADPNSETVFVLMDADKYCQNIVQMPVKSLEAKSFFDETNQDSSLFDMDQDEIGDDFDMEDFVNYQEGKDNFEDVDNYSDLDLKENDSKHNEDDIYFNEESPLDELERDGFVIEGEDEEPMYFEGIGGQDMTEPDLEPLDELNIDEMYNKNGVDIDQGHEDSKKIDIKESDGFTSLADEINKKIPIEESLDDVPHEDQDEEFFLEPVS